MWKLTGREPWCESEKKIDSNRYTSDVIFVQNV